MKALMTLPDPPRFFPHRWMGDVASSTGKCLRQGCCRGYFAFPSILTTRKYG